MLCARREPHATRAVPTPTLYQLHVCPHLLQSLDLPLQFDFNIAELHNSDQVNINSCNSSDLCQSSVLLGQRAERAETHAQREYVPTKIQITGAWRECYS